MVLQVRSSKTTQFKQRCLQVPLSFIHNHHLCPVTALTALLLHSQGLPPHLPFFTVNSSQGIYTITHNSFVKCLHQK